MAALTANTPQKYGAVPDEINEVMIADEALFVGEILVDGASAGSVQRQATETAGFAGIALDQATAAGDRMRVRRKGVIVTSINATVSAGDEGVAVYGAASSANPKDINKTSAANLPIGKIATVLTAGAANANLVAIAFESDGYVSR